jgi:hypothetical protein
MSQEVRDLLDRGPVAVNLGVQDFARSLEQQGVAVVQVQWKPPEEEDPEMTLLLDSLL